PPPTSPRFPYTTLFRSQPLEKVAILSKFCQSLFHLCHKIAFIRKGQLVPDILIHDISGATEVRNDRHGTTSESFKNCACTVVAKDRKSTRLNSSHDQIS